MVIQGREITHDDIESVRRLVKATPSWKRTRLSKELCVLWNWRAANGQMKDMACLLFGSAAWKSAPRDDFIGWDADTRKANLNLLTNNMQFLILPWGRVPHLASYILGNIARRISSDWLEKYGHPIYLLETFVEQERFQGICYRAANWTRVGQTKGRSRNDRYATLKVPIKDIYLYPLIKRFREALSHEA